MYKYTSEILYEGYEDTQTISFESPSRDIKTVIVYAKAAMFDDYWANGDSLAFRIKNTHKKIVYQEDIWSNIKERIYG